jgi:hypothetical protein
MFSAGFRVAGTFNLKNRAFYFVIHLRPDKLERVVGPCQNVLMTIEK